MFLYTWIKRNNLFNQDFSPLSKNVGGRDEEAVNGMIIVVDSGIEVSQEKSADFRSMWKSKM